MPTAAVRFWSGAVWRSRNGLSRCRTTRGPAAAARVCTALLQAELNIIQAYPLLVRPNGKPAVAIMVENIEVAMETLREKGFTIITEADLEGDPTDEI